IYTLSLRDALPMSAGGVGARNGAGGERVQQIFREFGKIGDVHAAVTAVRLPKLLGFEVLSERGGDDFPGEQLLDEFRVGPQRWPLRRGRVRILAVHPRA